MKKICGDNKMKKKRRTSNQIENWDSILYKFKKESPVKCFRCKKLLKKPIDCSYAHPLIFCKKCFKIIDEEDLEELGKGLKKII